MIGRQWAMIFTSFGYKCCLYDNNAELLAKAPELIRDDLASMCEKKLARGTLTLEERMALICTTESLEECLKDVIHVQESVFDDLALKQDLHEKIDQAMQLENTRAAICSSTSVHLPSKVFSKVTVHRDQCLVAHPVNPPFYVKLVELIPIQGVTREEITIRTRLVMDEIDQKPVVLRKEVSGFALNRLQYAVFQESFRLIREGVMTADDVDTVVSDGLGPRYAFMGPWMTAHLNAAGMADYLRRYSEGIYNVGKDCQPLLKLEGEAAQHIIDMMNHEVPIDKLDEKRAWRDQCLTELAKIKSAMDKKL